MNQASLAKRAIAASLWSTARFLCDQAVNFIVFVVAARLLSPDDIGRFAIAMIVYELARTVAVGGLPNVLLRAETITADLRDTVFSTTLLGSFLAAVLAVSLSDPIVAIAGAKGSGDLIAVLACALPVAALGSSHMALHLRDFGHRALAIRSVIGGVLGGSVAVFALLDGAGVWALVYQRLAVEVVGAGVSWWSIKWMPAPRISLSVLRQQIGLAASLSGAELVWIGLIRSQDVIIGRALGPAMVGVYRVAWKSIEMVSQGIVVPISNVAVPVLVRSTGQAAFERNFLAMTAGAVTLALPAALGIGLTARDLVPLFYGPQWRSAVPVLQVLSLLMIPLSLNQFIGQGLKVLGRSTSLLMIALIQSGLALSACIASARFGLTAVAFAFVAADYVGMIAQLWVFKRASGVRHLRLARTLLPQVVAAAAMAMAVLGFQILLGRLGWATPEPSWWRLTGSVMIGASIYGVGLALSGGLEPMIRAFRSLRESDPLPSESQGGDALADPDGTKIPIADS